MYKVNTFLVKFDILPFKINKTTEYIKNRNIEAFSYISDIMHLLKRSSRTGCRNCPILLISLKTG